MPPMAAMTLRVLVGSCATVSSRSSPVAFPSRNALRAVRYALSISALMSRVTASACSRNSAIVGGNLQALHTRTAACWPVQKSTSARHVAQRVIVGASLSMSACLLGALNISALG